MHILRAMSIERLGLTSARMLCCVQVTPNPNQLLQLSIILLDRLFMFRLEYDARPHQTETSQEACARFGALDIWGLACLGLGH